LGEVEAIVTCAEGRRSVSFETTKKKAVAHGGWANGIPKNFLVDPSDEPVTVAVSSLTVGAALRVGTAEARLATKPTSNNALENIL
jgi:hypothetical protein